MKPWCSANRESMQTRPSLNWVLYFFAMLYPFPTLSCKVKMHFKWLHSHLNMYLTAPDGRVRIWVDLTKLNQNIRCERHILPLVEQILTQLGGTTAFSYLDRNSGFWQIELSQESLLDNIYHTIQEVPFLSLTIWNYISTWAFSEANDT